MVVSIIATYLYSCNSNIEKQEKIETTEDFHNEVSYCEGRPKCSEKDGIEVSSSVVISWKTFNKKELSKQIPENYTGYLKICEEGLIMDYISCKNGIIDGITYRYSCEGDYDEQYYKNFVAEGTWIHYNSRGEYDYVRNFKNGLLHGESTSFDKETLKLLITENYFEGQLDGKSKKYYPSGNIREYNEHKKGINTVSKSYYENGNLSSEMIINKDGVTLELYDEDGKKITHTRPQITINRP
jgi:antitoxin component YwqK of YwqJK toxin-antitoxin module